MLTAFLQIHGFSCGVEDLVLKKKIDVNRIERIKKSFSNGIASVAEFCELKNYEVKEDWDFFNRSNFVLDETNKFNVNVLERKPEENYISEKNEIISKLEKKILLEGSFIYSY